MTYGVSRTPPDAGGDSDNRRLRDDSDSEPPGPTVYRDRGTTGPPAGLRPRLSARRRLAAPWRRLLARRMNQVNSEFEMLDRLRLSFVSDLSHKSDTRASG